MKKVIVTGASGFIGKALVKRLLENNVEVWAIVRNKDKLSGLKNDKLKIIVANFEEYLDLEKKIIERDFDCFYHFAWDGCGYSSNDYNVQYRNIKYTCDALSLAIKLKCKKFFFPESSHEYLKDTDGVLSNIYGITKSCTKNICKVIAKQNNIIYLGGIFANVFGIGDYSNRSANIIIKKLMNNEDLDLIEGNNLHEWTYIDDAIEAVYKITEEGKDGKSYFIAREKMYTFKEIIYIAKNSLKSKSILRFGEYKNRDEIDYVYLNKNLIYKSLIFKDMNDLGESIIMLARWLLNKENNMIDYNETNIGGGKL